MIRGALFALALPAFACHGCNDGNQVPANTSGSASATGSATAPAGPETTIKVEDDGKTVDLARGATLTVKLTANAGTGYQWTPAAVDASVLAQQGDHAVEGASDTPGAPRFDVYRFTGVGAGTATLQLDLKRPFGHQPPTKSFKVTVNVR